MFYGVDLRVRGGGAYGGGGYGGGGYGGGCGGYGGSLARAVCVSGSLCYGVATLVIGG